MTKPDKELGNHWCLYTQDNERQVKVINKNKKMIKRFILVSFVYYYKKTIIFHFNFTFLENSFLSFCH